MKFSSNRLLVLCLMALSASMSIGKEIDAKVDIKNQLNGYDIIVTNNEGLAIYAVIDFPKLEGFQDITESLPMVKRIAPATSVRTIRLLKMNQSYSSYEIEYNFLFADPREVKIDQQLLLLPFPNGEKHLLIQGWHGKKEHKGDREYSVDFKMNEGDIITAVRDGIVVQVHDTLGGEGVDSDINEKINYVLVRHKDNTFAHYVRLKHEGIFVSQGKFVKAGDKIAYVGQKDDTNESVFHFELSIPTLLGKMISIPFKFRAQDGKPLEIIENKYYYSYIPGHNNAEELQKIEASYVDFQKSLEEDFEKNIIKIRKENIGKDVIVYIANGFEKSVIAEVYLNFYNLRLTEEVPLIKKISPRSEIFLTKMSIIDEDEEFSLSSNIQYNVDE